MDYKYWTVKEIKDKLRELGLKITGNKSILIHRLKNYDESNMGKYSGMRMLDLRKLLFERNLSTKGSKNILIDRLRASDPSLKVVESAEHILTGVKDVDIQILLRLDDKDLFNACKIDKYTASLCTEPFWNEKIHHDYGGAILRDYKRDNTYKEIYRDLKYAEKANPSLQEFFNYITGTKYVPIAKYLVKLGANVTIDNIIRTHGNIEMLRFLANNISSISQKDINLLTEEVIYMLTYPLETLIIFKELGADIRNEKLLHNAMQSTGIGYSDKVKYLVENGTNIYNISEYTWFDAVSRKNNDIIIYLIEKGATVNMYKLLEDAVWMNNYEIAKYLLEKGYVNIEGDRHLLRKTWDNAKNMTKLLREYGAKYLYEDLY